MKLTEKDYNLSHNAIDIAYKVGKIDLAHLYDLTDKLNLARSSQDVQGILAEVQSLLVDIRLHSTKAKMIEFLASKGYRLLRGDDKVEGPLQSYCYQKKSGYYEIIYIVKEN